LFFLSCKNFFSSYEIFFLLQEKRPRAEKKIKRIVIFLATRYVLLLQEKRSNAEKKNMRQEKIVLSLESIKKKCLGISKHTI